MSLPFANTFLPPATVILPPQEPHPIYGDKFPSSYASTLDALPLLVPDAADNVLYYIFRFLTHVLFAPYPINSNDLFFSCLSTSYTSCPSTIQYKRLCTLHSDISIILLHFPAAYCESYLHPSAKILAVKPASTIMSASRSNNIFTLSPPTATLSTYPPSEVHNHRPI